MGQEVLAQNALSRELKKSRSIVLTNSRRVYSKDFLLSVSELEECKKVPTSLDTALLRGTEVKSNNEGVTIPEASSRGLIHTTRDNDAHSESPPDVPEWRRPSSLPGSPFLKHGPRQPESNVSSPRPGPGRGSNPARSIMGRSGSARWELRPGGVDLNHWESTASESGGFLHGRGFVRSALVVPQEHDGLLGSGGPIVNRGMIQRPMPDRHRTERASRAGRTGEQHHVTREGKTSRISQYTCWEDADSISDETFGSDDVPSGERAEQERQRRDEFEQMRRDLRMKPLNIARNYNDNWLGECVQEALVSSPGSPQSTSSSKDDILKPHNKAVASLSTPRLLVPPGFSKPAILKTGLPKENCEASKGPLSYVKDEGELILKQTISNDDAKLDKEEHISSLLQNTSSLLQNIGALQDKEPQTSNDDVKLDKEEHISPLLQNISSLLQNIGTLQDKEPQTSNDDVKLDREEHISSLLQNIGALQDKEPQTSSPVQSPFMSKFTRWFPSQGSTLKESESNIEEQKPSLSVAKSEALPPLLGILSYAKPPAELDAGSDDAALTKLSSVATLMPIDKKGSIVPMPIGPSLEDVEKVMTAGTDTVGVSSNRKDGVVLKDHLLPDGNKHDEGLLVKGMHPQWTSSKEVSEKMQMPPVFLTCEDIEQSLLGESDCSGKQSKLKEVQQDTEKNINLMQLLQTGSNGRPQNNTSQQSWAVEPEAGNGSASLHIMSLLQSKTGDAASAVPMADCTGKASAETSAYITGHDHRVEDAIRKGNQTNNSEIISLETLFGKGFVNELRSVGEPVSSKVVPDDPLRSGKEENLLDIMFSRRPSNKGSGRGEVGFMEDVGWDHDSYLNKGLRVSETMQQGPGVQNEFWSDTSPHGFNSVKASKELLSSRGFLTKGAASMDFIQPKPSPHLPHHGNSSHPQFHEGHHVLASEAASHRMPFERVQEPPPFVHDSPVYGMHMYGLNTPFRPYHQEGFVRASNHVPAHFDERSSVMGGVYRMPSAFLSNYPESVQMGFHPNLGMPDPRIGGSRIHTPVDAWFPGDPMLASQGPSGYNPYQRQRPPMAQERKPGHGASGTRVGLGVRSSNVDRWAHSETAQVPYFPGLDPYRTSGSGPD